MRKTVSAVRQLVLWVSLPALLGAQDAAPHRPVNTYHPPGNNSAALVSPEVHADRTITFRVSAPGAMEVSVFADGTHAMTKDAGGIWSVTLGPLAPEI